MPDADGAAIGAELAAMQGVAELLDPLTVEARVRVLTWASDYVLDRSNAEQEPTTAISGH